jgi:uncharacterized protein (DUF169 family)
MAVTQLLQTLDQALQTHIRPATFPLAIRMLAEGEALPERYKRPKRDFGEEMAICQAFAMVRHTGRVIAMNGDDLSCPLAKAVWGFEPLLGYFLNGMTCAGMYTETPAAGAVTEAGVDKWDYRQWAYVAAAPLSR